MYFTLINSLKYKILEFLSILLGCIKYKDGHFDFEIFIPTSNLIWNFFFKYMFSIVRGIFVYENIDYYNMI